MTTEQQTPAEALMAAFIDEIATRVAAIITEQQPAEPEQDRLLTLDEVGEILRVTERTVRKYVGGKDPWLPSVRVGHGARRVWKSKLDAAIAARED
jgi:hypothetical protein